MAHEFLFDDIKSFLLLLAKKDGVAALMCSIRVASWV